MQNIETVLHMDFALVVRYQEEAVRELTGRLIAGGDFMSLEVKPRSIPFGLRIKYLFIASVQSVSVIVPTWNEEKYLPRCLASLAKQPCKEQFEVIVVDGGSTDRTIDIARKYADRVLIKPGEPVGAARNIGAKEANGGILAFIDADTIACGNWLDQITHGLGSNSRAVGVTGPTLPYEGTQVDELLYHIATGWVQRLSFRLGFPHVAGFNCAYRKKAFWDAGGFDEDRDLSEDVVLSLRIRHEGQIVFNPRMVAFTSLRRIKKYGYPYLTTYYLINGITLLLFERSLAYPKIR